MGTQAMVSHGSRHQPHLQQLARQNSWFSLTLDELQNQLGYLGKPLASMDLDDLLKVVLSAEGIQSNGVDFGVASPLQATLTLVRRLNGKTVDEVWWDIQQGQKMRAFEGLNCEGRELTLGEMTLGDFLVKAGLFAAENTAPVMGLDIALSAKNYKTIGLSPSPSLDTLSDTPRSGRKRDPVDGEKTLDRKLRRKINNRESAARSRARKQAYHNELVSKVSRLEEENTKLKKEKEFESVLGSDMSSEPRYQLRRTSSF